eukprot:TRINITY_DN113838_c0_g1_i1.p1 TRINITY_DN113838_c0_g1~~TRINITY_DN113838_c0_g1_i1.p1  ORF type:complete len:310 (+),score=25.09 TRINITY_DN113838_c0_g1_i1:73-1002(+)
MPICVYHQRQTLPVKYISSSSPGTEMHATAMVDIAAPRSSVPHNIGQLSDLKIPKWRVHVTEAWMITTHRSRLVDLPVDIIIGQDLITPLLAAGLLDWDPTVPFAEKIGNFEATMSGSDWWAIPRMYCNFGQSCWEVSDGTTTYIWDEMGDAIDIAVPTTENLQLPCDIESALWAAAQVLTNGSTGEYDDHACFLTSMGKEMGKIQEEQIPIPHTRDEPKVVAHIQSKQAFTPRINITTMGAKFAWHWQEGNSGAWQKMALATLVKQVPAAPGSAVDGPSGSGLHLPPFLQGFLASLGALTQRLFGHTG